MHVTINYYPRLLEIKHGFRKKKKMNTFSVKIS